MVCCLLDQRQQPDIDVIDTISAGDAFTAALHMDFYEIWRSRE